MMKRILITLSVLLAALALVTLPAFAGQFQVGSRTYWVDGKPYQMDAAPFIANNRTCVPVRYLALALGVAEKDIAWDARSGTVTLKLGDMTVKLTMGKKTIYVNGQAKQMDVAPVIKSGRTYLPARWVAEALGYEAKWEAAAKKIVFTPANRTEPASPDPIIDGKIVGVYHYEGGVLSGANGKYWYLRLSNAQPRQLTITDPDTKQKRTATVRIPQFTITDPDTGKKRTYDVASPDTWWGFPVGWYVGTSAKKLSNDPVARKWIQDPVVVRFGLDRVIFGAIDGIAQDYERRKLEQLTKPPYTPTVPNTTPTYSPVQPWSPGGMRW